MQLYKKTSSTEVHTETADSGLVDAKGRKIGYLITISENTWEKNSTTGYAANQATRFWAATTTTRNGAGFGPWTLEAAADTLEAAIAAGQKRRDASFKNAAKKLNRGT